MSEWRAEITDVRLNRATLVAISNIANDKMARPRAERAAARSGLHSARVEATPRTGWPDWARSRVVIDAADVRREVESGALSRSLNGG